MALDKVTYVDGQTVIHAKNLNDIQDAIIENQEKLDEIYPVDPTLTSPTQAAQAGAVGDAVNNLKESISGFYNEEVTLSLVANESVKSTTGETQENAGYSRSTYIDVRNAKKFKLYWTDPSDTGTTLNAICFYDSGKVYISGEANALNRSESYKTRDIPSGTKYVIFSGTSIAMGKVSASLVDLKNTIGELVDGMKTKADFVSVFTDVEYIKQKQLLQNVIGVSKFPGNLVNIEECINNCYVNATTNGNLTINAPNYFSTGFIPVTAGNTYKSNLGRNYAWYDSNKNYISGAFGENIQTGITAPSIPTSAAYIRFTINKTTDGINSPVYLYFADSTDYDNSVIIPNLVVPSALPWCNGKKINWIGDSIVAGEDFDEEVCSALGLIKNNEYGINGSTIALSANGGDERNAVCERYDDMTDDADIVAVSCGTNDFEYAWCPIGTINDPDDGTSNTTFYGALKALCKGLIDKYPRKLIFFTTPIKRAQPFENGNGGEYTADGVMTTPFSKNKYGKTLGDYADIIKEVCGYYSIPVLDMYRESLLNPSITSQQSMFDNVYTHPNATGKKIMARRVCGWMTQLGYNIDGLN